MFEYGLKFLLVVQAISPVTAFAYRVQAQFFGGPGVGCRHESGMVKIVGDGDGRRSGGIGHNQFDVLLILDRPVGVADHVLKDGHGQERLGLGVFGADLGDGWEDADVHKDPEEVRLKALQMGANIIQFVFMDNTSK